MGDDQTLKKMKVFLAAALEDDEIPEIFSDFSSDDEEIEAVGNILSHSIRSRHCIKNYLDVVKGYNDGEFITHFRVTSDLFNELCQDFSKSEVYKQLQANPKTRLAVNEEESILIFLWFAGHRCTYADLADRFNVAHSSAHQVVKRVTDYLSNKSSEVIQLPNQEEKNDTANYFMEQKKFPNIIGCIDGSHFQIDKPKERDCDYMNRKQYYSFNVQAVCNEHKKFIEVTIGFPGSVHDARIFENSSFSKKVAQLCENGRYILGDSAYPLRKDLLVPYKDNGHLTQIQKKYNTRLSSCRIFIEHSFGILKQRFPQLYHIRMRSHEKICHFIRACMVLHNMSRDNTFDDLPVDIQDDQPDLHIYEGGDDIAAKVFRDEICESLL